MAEWAKSILVFTIFSSVILFVMPDEKYKKYIQTAIGFVMIIVVINPVVEMLGFADKLSFNIRYEMRDEELISIEDTYYADVLSAIIEDELNSEYGITAHVQVYIDESQKVSSIELSGFKIDMEMEESIRNNLSYKYGINEDMIIIY
ncbi:MAG: stage III sporulation protein AF [Coprococcus sp.]